MTLILLKTGLVLTAYYELLLKLLPYSLPTSPDTRVAKLFVGMWLTLALYLSALFSNEIRKVKNRWLLLFILYIPLSIHLSPQYNIELNGVLSTNFWVWKPFVLILCYFGMFVSVQSLNITKHTLRSVFSVMVWCGAIMAGYIILQRFGWDQFFIQKTSQQFTGVTQQGLVGSLGQPTIVSPFIAMIVPFAIYLRRYGVAVLLIIAVVLTQSAVAIGAMIISLLVYACLRWRLRAVLAVVLVIVASSVYLSFNKGVMSELADTNGRSHVWSDSIRVLKEERFGQVVKGEKSEQRDYRKNAPYTGIGLGSYSVLIQPKIKSNFDKAHNEYLEILCTMGIGGVLLFLMAIGYMLKTAFHTYNIEMFNRGELTALMSSFICISIIAGGTFIWQLSPHQFYTVLVAGLLSNRRLLKGEML